MTHPLSLVCCGLYGLPEAIYERSDTVDVIPLTARCFIPSVLSHVSDTVATSADILAAHATMVAPFGVTIYDYELTHSVPPRRTSDAFHSFITADEQRNQLYFYCHTRKTYMPRSQRLGLLKMQNQAHTLHHGCDDAAGEALAQLPLFDTNILVVVTGESCMGTLRAAMSAFIDSVPPDEALTPSHAELLYAQLRSVMTLPFTVTPTVVGSSRRFEFTPAPDSTGEDAPTAHLTVVVVGGKTICLQPAGRHSWERIPTVDWAPPDTTNGPADPVVPSSFLPARFARGGSASRRIVSYWTCPSCKRTSPNVSRAVGADSGPTHWCLSCRCCNLCVVKDAPPARTRPDSSEPGASFASLMTQPCSSPLPHQDVDLSILFSRLDTRNVINVLLAIMCHQAVLVVSEDLGILADVIAGFLSLLHPFKSEKNVVPIGFKSFPMKMFLESPFPVLMGTTPSFLLSEDEAVLSDPAEVAATPHRDAFDATMSSSGSLSSKVSRTNSPAAVSTGVGTEDVAPSGEESLSFFKRLLSRLGGSPKASLSPTSNMGSQGGSPGDVMRTQSSRSYGAMSPSSPHTHRQSRRSHREPSHFPSQLSTALTAAARESPDDRAKRLLKRFQGVVPQEVLVVDLDCNAVSPLSSTLDMQLPPRLLLRIFEAIIRHGNMYSVLHPEYEQPHPDLPRSMTPLERQRWELSFNQVRDRMQEQLTAARARVQAATFAAVGGSATKSLTPTGQSTKGGFGSPGTPDSTHSGRGSTTNSPSGNATPMQFQAPATLNILNSDDERSDPMAGLAFSVTAESFPWEHHATQSQLTRVQYTVPTQLSGDDLSGDARDAVGALIQKIAIRPPALVRQRSHVSLHTLDPDGLSTAVGMNYDRVRMAILSVMVSLFRSYRMYIKIGPGRQLPITLRTRSHSDDIVSTGVGIPLSSAVVTSSSAQSGVEGAAGVPLARKPPTPRFKDLFSIEEFLAEQTHDESRALLRYCVTVFMPFFMFVTERCEWQGEADLFDRMCFDSMSSRAAIYDRVMNRSLENELLILMKRGAAFDLDALRVPKAQEEAPVSDVDDDSTLEPNGWVWRSVLVNLRSNSTELRIHAISAGYEDTKEAWIQAGLDYKAGIGAYETVSALKESLSQELAACPTVAIPLQYGRTSVTAPSSSRYPRAGPIYVFEVLESVPLESLESNAMTCVVMASESGDVRREWILQLKSRLRSATYIDTLRDLYLAHRSSVTTMSFTTL